MKKIVLLFTLSFFLIGCPSDEYSGKQSLCIKNISGKNMYFWFSYDFSNYHFPNNTLPLKKPGNIRGTGSSSCVGNDAGQYPSWDKIFSELPSDKFTVYFFKTFPDTEEEWELLISDENNYYVKNVTWDELKANDYTITYP